ncbi:MAG: STN domain-containing protein, partial [Prolixibacteraceae bacterium]
MKKKQTNGVWLNHIVFKCLRMMKVTLGLFLILVAQGWATSAYSQKAVLNLDMENVRIVDVLEEIEDQTDFYFLFNYEQIHSDKRISVSLANAAIEETLNLVLKGTDLKYT